LVSLDVHQYHHRGLHDVMRHKSKRVSKKIPLPQEARDFLERYLATRTQHANVPLFTSRYGKRLAAQDVGRICLRLLKQASAYLSEDEKFRFTPHMLRHIFLKRVADKHGIHFAQQMSGNVSIKEVFRYVKPSQAEIDRTVEELF
jgi:integrase/recombinase XerD